MALKILRRKFDPALAVALKFLAIGIIWILFSDSLIQKIDANNFLVSFAHIQTVKGILFVGVTAGVFFTILHTYTQKIKLLKREQQYYFASNPVPMILVDSITFRFYKANDAAIKMFGYSREQMRAFNVYHLIADEERTKFESVLVFIKTGYDKLGSWKFIPKDGVPFYANISSIAIREQQLFLITFQDIGDQVKTEEELKLLHEKLIHEVGKHTEQLELRNEELAYRASQTQHVNDELILVNEQLLNVNKKIVVERDNALAVTAVLDQLKHVAWAFNLSDSTRNCITPSAAQLFDENISKLQKPWFWLDFIHPEDAHIVEQHQKRLSDEDESTACYRIITKCGGVKQIFDHSKIVHQNSGNHFLAGSFIEITDLQIAATNMEHELRHLRTPE